MPPLGAFIFFGDLVSKNIGVSQSDRLAPKIHQNTESLKFSIRQSNPNRNFGLNLTSHDMPLHDSGRCESHHGVTGVPESYFLQRGRLRALLPTWVPVQHPFSTFITATALTALTATLIATTNFRFTTLRLTPFDRPMVVLRNCSRGVIAWGIGCTTSKNAIVDTPINAVVHIRLLPFFPMFGTRDPNGLIGS